MVYRCKMSPPVLVCEEILKGFLYSGDNIIESFAE